jgi:CRP/FNR family transcriptional regulator, cyclic AMP receptor protein
MRKVLYLFGSLTDADVDWIARTGVRRRVSNNEIVIHERKPIESIIFLLQGEFAITVQGLGEVARLGVGEIVGEMSFVDSAPPSASVTAIGGCLALFLDKETLAKQLEADIAFGCRFYRALAILLGDRLREGVRRLGYGDAQDLDPHTIAKDELDMGVLDTVSIAGERFERMLKMLIGER